MSWDDFQFSVRTGPAIGKASENRMLDAMGGQDTIKKRFQTSDDGSVTMAHTRGPGAQPEFITTGRVTPTNVKYKVYMESGQLSWTFPGEGNPAKYDSAKWHFLDIPTTAEYLGHIAAKPPSTGAQENAPELSEGMESLAVGYPRNTDPANDAIAKDTYAASTLMRKLMLGAYPASVFSGKMRLFMQAQYGAKEKPLAGTGLVLEVLGSELLLKYANGGATITLGVWANNSVGIFTASDGTFWALQITNPSGTTYRAVAYALTPDAAVKSLLERYRTGGLSPEETTKIEGYIFAHSTIDVANPKTVGDFDGGAGGAMAYGWKWKMDGSRASIVVHELLGSGAADLRWKATTMHLTFTYSGGSFGLYGEKTTHGEWTDGWGVYNIFVPEYETNSAPLSHWSVATNRPGVKPAFNFSGVPVYGYYKSDTWMPVELSRTISEGPFPIQKWSSAGITYPDEVANNPAFISSRHQLGGNLANQGCSYEQHSVSSGDRMSVSFDGETVNGVSEYGTHMYYTKTVARTGVAPNAVSWNARALGGAPSLPEPPGYVDGAEQVGLATTVNTTTSFTGTVSDAWALVIPALDAEAVYIARHRYSLSDAYTNSIYTRCGIDSFFGTTFNFSPWAGASGGNGWYGITSNEIIEYTSTTPESSETTVMCFNTAVSGINGVPGGSYYTLFNVDRNYPQYDRGMYMRTSFGGRYMGSELPATPASVTNSPFVGWA